MLHVTQLLLIARKRAVQTLSVPPALPIDQLIMKQTVIACVTLAEQQPVAALFAFLFTCFQMRPQTSDACAVTDEYHRLIDGRRMGTGVATNADWQLTTDQQLRVDQKCKIL